MFDQQMIANIRESGLAQGAAEVEARNKLLGDIGFRVANGAEYALITSCFLPSLVTQDARCFARLLDHLGVDYTLLPTEYCCGNLLYRQALKDKTGEALKEADALAGEFLENNFGQARELGVRKLFSYCVGCDQVYRRLRDSLPLEVMWYPTLLAQVFEGGKLELEADYYAGCHYFYRQANSNSLPDLDSALTVLQRIEGLKLNQLNHRLCCTRPQQAEALVAGIKNHTIITVCASCKMFLEQALKDKGDYRVLMLPEVAWASVSGEGL